jgi:hypothetical protein
MNFTLEQILALVGRLDDSPGDDTPRCRFRRFLCDNIKTEVGPVRDYIEACLRTSGEQYNRALQDLVNYTGQLLGFEVTYGRYHGVVGQIGFDGHWVSPADFHLVVEAKTTEVYAINAATLVGYVDGLISEKKIPNWDHALGLYVVGRPDPEVHQLENAIIAEKRTNQLRVISVESLLSLAEMIADYGVSHSDILSVLRPSCPTVNPLVDLISRVAAAARLGVDEKTIDTPALAAGGGQPVAVSTIAGTATTAKVAELNVKGVRYWLFPVTSDEERTAEEWIRALVIDEQLWATFARRQVNPGDRVCFYAAQTGVVAHATVRTQPEHRQHPIAAPDEPLWIFGLEHVVEYLDNPVVIDAALRAKLDAFQGKDPNKAWAWFVQGAHTVAQHDFALLTRPGGASQSPPVK